MGKAPIKKILAVRKFTDREEPREAFNRILEDAQRNTDEFNVLTYYGIGGFGKTRLIHELSKQLDEDNDKNKDIGKIAHVVYDFAHGTDKMNVIEKLKNLLKKQGLSFPYSDALEAAYNIKCGNPVYKTASEQQLIDNPMLSIVAGFIPGASDVLSIIKKGRTIMDEGNKFYAKLQKKWNVDKQKLNEEIKAIGKMSTSELEEKTAYYFAQDLYKNTEHASSDFRLPVVIFLDTYEELVNSYQSSDYAGSYDLWLRDDIIKTVPGIFWIIGGRERLKWEEQDDFWEGAIEQHELGDLSKTDSFDFLRTAGIPEEFLEDIYGVTGGTPLFLDLNVSTYYELLASGQKITRESFGNNREQIIERFLRYMDLEDQLIAKLLAVLENWSDEEAKLIGKKVLPVFYPDNYENFIEHTIIIKDNEQRYYMHQQVRNVILAAAVNNNAEMVRNIYVEKMRYYSEKDFDVLTVSQQAQILKTMTNVLIEAGFDNDTYLEMYGLISDKIVSINKFGLYNLVHETYQQIIPTISEDNPLRLEIYYTAAYGAMRTGHYNQALDYAEKAELLCRKDSPAYLQLLNIRAISLMGNNELEKAGNILNELLAIYEKNGQVESDEALNVINNLGLYYERKKDNKNALAMYQKAYNIAIDTKGVEDAFTQRIIVNYAHELNNTGWYDLAYALHKMTYDLSKARKSDQYRGTLSALQSMANDCYEMEDYALATEYYEKLMEDCKEVYGDNEYGFLANMARCYKEQQKYTKALECADALLKKYVDAFGRHSQIVYETEDLYEEILRSIDPQRKLKIQLENVNMITEANVTETPRGCRILYNAGLDYMECRDYEKGLEYLTKAHEIRGRNLSDNDTTQLRIEHWTGRCHFLNRDFVKAAEVLKECYTKTLEVFGSSSKQERAVLHDLWQALDFCDDYADLRKWQHVYEITLIHDTARFLRVKLDMAYAYLKMNKPEECLITLERVYDLANKYSEQIKIDEISPEENDALKYGYEDLVFTREREMFESLLPLLEKSGPEEQYEYFLNIWQIRQEVMNNCKKLEG